jgi:serine/threonine-protein kinase
MQLFSGTRLGRYEIRSKIGAGGMGEVYLAHDPQLRRLVALKILPSEFMQSENRLRRFEQEAYAASALNHPNIITIHEIGKTESLHYIVTEYVEGESLRQHMAGSASQAAPGGSPMKSAPLKLGEVLDTAIQIASALSAAHAAGIIHRDIKPDNVMLRRDGIAKVLDFGLAKLTATQTSDIDPEAATRALINTGAGVVMGTASYMSPEQARGLEVDARTDIWSLGVMLYEMAVGRAPFEGATPTEVIARIIEREPAPLTRYSPELPAELARIITKALEKDREERYQTTKDLLIDLKRLKRRIEIDNEIERSIQPEQFGVSPSGVPGAQTSAPEGGPPNEQATSSAEYIVNEIKRHKLAALVALLIVAAALIGLWFYVRSRDTQGPINSVAVLPFINASGNSDVEYLSDGITESLINSLSQLLKLSVKARSSVFRYKGKEVEPQQVAKELSVQAILTGRVVQRGDDLTLYLSLVDGRNGNQIWGEQYSRKLTDLVSLQSEIARDVSQKLQVRLSGADKQKLAKNYTENAEAYQLYLKGRYHLFKLKRSETQKGVEYFQQAIAIDPSYALAYVGLAEAYRALTLSGEMPSTEYMPKARAAAQKAIEIDETLAEAHSALGMIIMWYDWDWNDAEKQCKRALELNPNSSDAHLVYAHLLSNTGRHAGALAEAKRARELDPLNLRTNTLEGQFLIHAGRTDEALARFQKIFELDSNFWFAHVFASSAYIEKGMFAEAVAEAHKARELSGGISHPFSFLGYALAKSGKQAEARAVLEELLKLSTERYVPPYYIAMIYDGLDERDEAMAWLERGYVQRDPRMALMKVEPKWNNLRGDPRFQDLLRRLNLLQ